MEINFLPAYLIAVTLLTLTPGVDTLLIIRNSCRGGWKDGVVSSVGICSGLFVHAVISAVGISVILLHTAWAFALLKLAGAGYLIWLGLINWKGILRPGESTTTMTVPGTNSPFRFFRSLREGFLSNVLNPKTAVFYMAFLPQFINPAHNPLAQSLVLAGGHFLIAMVWQSVLALLVNRMGQLLKRPRIGRIMAGVTGSVMIGLGVKLAADG